MLGILLLLLFIRPKWANAHSTQKIQHFSPIDITETPPIDLPKPPIKTPSTFKLINEKIIIAACKRQQNSH